MSIETRLQRLEAEALPELDIAAELSAARAAKAPRCTDDDLVRDGSRLALRIWHSRQRAACQVPPSTLTPQE